MDLHNARLRLREGAKLGVRRGLGRWGLDLGSDPYPHRVARSLTSHGIDSVLDVGANVGQYAGLLRAAGYAGRIVSVEPLAGPYAQLVARSRRDPDWTTVNCGVGSEPGSVTMHVSANLYSSSILAIKDSHLEAAPDSAIVGSQETVLTTVAALVAEQRLDPARCLLKIDTQGYESHVLDGAGSLLDEFASIQLELSFVELYDGQMLFDELLRRVRGHGLSIWGLEPGFSDHDGRLLQCDALFMRERRG